jgi:hypothetical protein
VTALNLTDDISQDRDGRGFPIPFDVFDRDHLPVDPVTKIARARLTIPAKQSLSRFRVSPL